MTFAIGDHVFDHVTYDSRGDVLYVRSGEPRPAANVYGTPEGHAVGFDEQGSVIGITISSTLGGSWSATEGLRSPDRGARPALRNLLPF